MWLIGLACDGCHEDLAICKVAHKLKDRLAAGKLTGPTLSQFGGLLKIHATAQGWERVESPDDGERWFCPACRRARNTGELAATNERSD